MRLNWDEFEWLAAFFKWKIAAEVGQLAPIMRWRV